MKYKLLSGLLTTLIRIHSGCVVRSFPGYDHSNPVVFYSNHTSNLDFPVIWAALPRAMRSNVRPIAAADYWSKGRLRPFLAMRIFNALLIERKSVSRDNSPLPPMLDCLDNGQSLIVFPEGTRSLSGKLGLMKSGSYHLAKSRPQTQFIPVYLENLFRILPKGEVLPLPLVATLNFGEPLKLQEHESKDDFLKRMQDRLLELKSEDHLEKT